MSNVRSSESDGQSAPTGANGRPPGGSRLGRSIYRLFGIPYTPAHADRGIAFLIWKIVRKFVNVVLIPNIPFLPLRIFLYRCIGFTIGKGCEIGMKTYMDDVHPERTIVEDLVTVSYNCTFAVHGPGTSDTDRIVLRRGCYVGVACTIVGNVKIGECATIGAGSLVIHDIPAYCTAVGVPAKVIKTDTVPFEWSRAAVEAARAPTREGRRGAEGAEGDKRVV